MNRFFELGATLITVALFTAVLVAVTDRHPSTSPPAPAPGQVPKPPPTQRPTPPEPSPEVEAAPALDEVWREDFDDLDAWRLEKGKPATIEDGIVTLHDAPANAPLYAQRRPLRFDAADLVIRARSSSGGSLHMGVARAVNGLASELEAPPNSPKARDGVELQIDWKADDELSAWVRWKLDGHHWFTLPTQDASLPQGPFTTMVVRIRPDGFSVKMDEEERGSYEIPRRELHWREGAYRLYVGCSGADPEIDFIELRPIKTEDAPTQEESA